MLKLDAKITIFSDNGIEKSDFFLLNHQKQ